MTDFAKIACSKHGIKYGYCEECAFPREDSEIPDDCLDITDDGRVHIALAPSVGKQAAPTRCETTLTERAPRTACNCDTYPENLGPCATFEASMRPNYCAYCDHRTECHRAHWGNASVNLNPSPNGKQEDAATPTELCVTCSLPIHRAKGYETSAADLAIWHHANGKESCELRNLWARARPNLNPTEPQEEPASRCPQCGGSKGRHADLCRACAQAHPKPASVTY